MDGNVAIDLASEAISLAPTDPLRAQQLIRRVRAEADGALEPLAMIERAAGLLALGRDVAEGTRRLSAAVALAERGGLPVRAAEARMSLAMARFLGGDGEGALRETDLAAPALSGLPAARLASQRAAILARLGRRDEALAGYRSALAALRRYGDLQWEAKALQNRGWLRAYSGEWRAAERDLERAVDLYLAEGDESSAAAARHNLGFVAGRRGDVPVALRRFDQADERYREVGRYRGQLLLDRAEVLLGVRLVAEARRDAQAAVAEAARKRMSADLPEARLMLARAALLDGDPVSARAAATEARRAFARQRRPAWAALARHVGLRAAWEGRLGGPSLLRSAREAAGALAAAGFAAEALDARLIAALVALAQGRRVVARRELEKATTARRTGTAELRAQAWHAEALRRLADGDRRGAEGALLAGLRVVEEFQATLGATELRAHAAAHGEELAQLGLRLSLQDADPAKVLGWAERWRAGTLRLRPARPPDDPTLAADLAALRRVAAEVEEAALSGRDPGDQLDRRADLEVAVRNRARHATGLRGRQRRVALPELRAALGERALIVYVELDGRLHAVTVSGRRRRVVDLGAWDVLERELAALRFALRRLAARRGSLAAARVALQRGSATLDALLLAPLREDVADRGLVIVPTGAMHAVPWAALPGVTGRALTLAPSATLWRQVACGDAPANDGIVLVAGPGLPCAEPEIDDLALAYPAALRLKGADATVSAVAAALEGTRLAHVAAHGSFRADNPLFSRLDLADGPLTVYDLERLRRSPEVLVLSACESGLSEVRPGDELMGLVAALFALGTRTVVASVAPVPDEATAALMRRFHAGLLAGSAPAEALAAAQAAVRDDGDEGLAAAAGFVCFGAG